MSELRILIVDDSAVVRRTLGKQLQQRWNAEVTLAEDGRQGLERALAARFDLIITDVEMPGLNGYELCRQLKENSATRPIPVIVLSSHDTEQDIDAGFAAGAAAHVSKTDPVERLHETIDRVLRKASFHRERLILVVDDSPTIRSMVRKGLERAGFQVATAENGKRGLEYLREQRPDLILSDIDMPEMNGVEFCTAVHGLRDFAAIPFVIMSSNNDRAILRRMLERGASNYLVKPFNLEQLIITIENLLSDQFLLLLKEHERLETERQMMLASITSLVTALEARDAYTRGHTESVAEIVIGMAGHINVAEEEIKILCLAAKLHDLGKIGVPDSVLLKPGRLTDEEFAVIKRHPEVGAQILQAIPTLREMLPVILHHHERFDGKGYPSGLKGEENHFWARMSAVADTYHAITSDRPYRQGMSREKALQIIEEVKGTQLCPQSVEIFMSWIALQKGKGYAA